MDDDDDEEDLLTRSSFRQTSEEPPSSARHDAPSLVSEDSSVRPGVPVNDSKALLSGAAAVPPVDFRTFGNRRRRISEALAFCDSMDSGGLSHSSSFAGPFVPLRKRASALELNGHCYLAIEPPPAATAASSRCLDRDDDSEYRGGVGSLPRGRQRMMGLMQQRWLEESLVDPERSRSSARVRKKQRSLSRSGRDGSKRQLRNSSLCVLSAADLQDRTSVATKDKELFS